MAPRFLVSFPIQLFAVCGLAFMLAGGAWALPKFKVLHNFGSDHDGGGLYSPLVLDSAGNLYGVTAGGGTGCNDYGCGTAFELSTSSGQWEEAILYNFCTQGNGCTDGEDPLGPLVFDSSRNLYGGAGSGGSRGHGVMFELSLGGGGWNDKVLYETASCCLVLDAAGGLYGITGPGRYNAGVVSEWSPGSDGWTYADLYSFDPQKGDGFITDNPLIFDQRGNLYGTTLDGGTGGAGNVFQVSPVKRSPTGEWTEHILHSFPAFNGDGQQPYAGLVFDKSGNLYGATEGGGTVNQTCPQGCGTIYKLTPDGQGGWTETILHRFPTFKGGFSPLGAC